MKKIVILLFTLMIFMQPVFSATWEQFTEKSYIDVESIRPNLDILGEKIPGEFVFWTKNLNNGKNYFKDREKEYNKKIWYILNQEIVNCPKRTLAIKSVIIYDTNSNVIDSTDFQHYLSPQSVVPESVGEILYNGICGNN